MSSTVSPQRCTHFTMFCAALTAPVTMCTLRLEPHARHADRLADAFLVVDDEFLRQDVEDLLVGRDRDRLRRVDHALDVART